VGGVGGTLIGAFLSGFRELRERWRGRRLKDSEQVREVWRVGQASDRTKDGSPFRPSPYCFSKQSSLTTKKVTEGKERKEKGGVGSTRKQLL